MVLIALSSALLLVYNNNFSKRRAWPVIKCRWYLFMLTPINIRLVRHHSAAWRLIGILKVSAQCVSTNRSVDQLECRLIYANRLALVGRYLEVAKLKITDLQMAVT